MNANQTEPRRAENLARASAPASGAEDVDAGEDACAAKEGNFGCANLGPPSTSSVLSPVSRLWFRCARLRRKTNSDSSYSPPVVELVLGELVVKSLQRGLDRFRREVYYIFRYEYPKSGGLDGSIGEFPW